MRDPALLDTLELIHDLCARSFVRYLVETARPLTRDAWDRRALGLLQVWDQDTLTSLQALEDLLHAEKVHPGAPAWPIDFSQYNLLSPMYLLGPVIRRMEPHLERLRAEAQALRVWPEASRLVESVLEKERAHLQEVHALWADRPREPPRPAVKKGVSANFW